MTSRLWPVMLMLVVLVGCQTTPRGGGAQQFADEYRQALSQGQYDVLYSLLGSESKMRLSNELERLRLLPTERQRAFAAALGDPPLGDLQAMTDQQFFARIWYQAVREKPITVVLQNAGAKNATIVLVTDDGGNQPLDIFVERERWVWRLPWGGS